MSLRKAAECVKKYKNFLIASHTNPEGDALGSELAFYILLCKLGKNAIILNEDEVPCAYDFLPAKENVKKYKPNMKNINFDCFVVIPLSVLKPTYAFGFFQDNEPYFSISRFLRVLFFIPL